MDIKTTLLKKFENTVNDAFLENRDGFNFINVELKLTNFDDVIVMSKKISEYLDEINYSEDEYYLDVYSSGTEQDIDVNNIEKHLNESVQIELKTAIKGNLEFVGDLVEANETKLKVLWNAKGQFRKQEIDLDNIENIKLFTKIGKV